MKTKVTGEIERQGDLDADMVNAALRVFGEEVGDRRFVAQGVEELDLGLAELHEGDGDAVVGESLLRESDDFADTRSKR